VQEIDARSDSGCEEIQIVKKVLESMCVQWITLRGLWLKMTCAQLLVICMLLETQWDRMLFRREVILLWLGLLCVTLFNLDTLCLTYSDPDRVPIDSHMLNGWNNGLRKDEKWCCMLPLKKPWRLSWSGRISNWLLEDSVLRKTKGTSEDFWHANFLAHYLL